MVEFSNPLQQLLFDKLVDAGRLDPNNLHISTIETIKSIGDADVLKLLKDFGGKPTIAKKEGGIIQYFQNAGEVNADQGPISGFDVKPYIPREQGSMKIL